MMAAVNRLTAALSIALAVLLSACDVDVSVGGGLNLRELEDEISEGLVEQTGVEIDSVRCPATRDPAEGDVFTCRVQAADGSEGLITVTQTDDEGNVNWEVTDVIGPDDAG